MLRIDYLLDTSHDSDSEIFSINYPTNTLLTHVTNIEGIKLKRVSAFQITPINSVDLSDSKIVDFRQRLKSRNINMDVYELTISDLDENQDDIEWVKNSVVSAYGD